MVLLVVAVLLVALLGVRQIIRLSGSRTTVLVAASELATGAVVGDADLREIRLARSKVPDHAVTDRAALVGQRLARGKAKGQAFVGPDLAAVVADSGSIARLVPEGRVLATLQVSPLSVPYNGLRRGDRLEIVAAGGRSTADHGGHVGTVAQDAYLVGWLMPPGAQAGAKRQTGKRSGLIDLVLQPPPSVRRRGGRIALLLALRPDDVLRVAEAQATHSSLSLVVHGRADVQAGSQALLPQARPQDEVELIAGATRERVSL